ncbi:MAG: beta strand repeat-containing protein, partial [Cytophaga sp.]|uniref:beta strand repeat-containing protein n=1 Tax=Cytophaga sp. TaxID=29535 RepID=UPI003F7F652D
MDYTLPGKNNSPNCFFKTLSAFYKHLIIQNKFIYTCAWCLIFCFVQLTDINAATVNSIAAGNWGTGSTWSTGSTPGNGDIVNINNPVTLNSNMSPSSGAVYTFNATSSGSGTLNMSSGAILDIRANVTFTGSGFNLNGGIIYVRSGYTLTLPGFNESNTAIYVESGATLVVNGNLLNNHGTIQVDGTLTVNGNYDGQAADAAITGSGDFTTTGYMKGINASMVFGVVPNCNGPGCNGRNLCSGFTVSAAPASLDACSILSSQTFTATVVPASPTPTYQWSSSSSQTGTYSDISGATNATYSVSGLGNSKTFYRVRATVSCTKYSDPVYANSSSSLVFLGSTSITGTAAVCQNTLQTYSAATTNAIDYIWSVPAGSVITSGQGTSSITVLIGGTSGSIGVTAKTGCYSNNATKAITVTPIQTSPGSITGSASLCQNSTGNVFSIAAVSGATGYTWVLPSGASITSGSNTNSITVTMGTSSGNIIVTPTNACGGSSASSVLAVTISSAVPSAAGTITGTTPVCSGITGVAYSISSVSGATSYTWAVPSGAAVASGTGTTAITVNWGSTGGNVTVTPVNGCGSGTSKSLAVTVNTVPSAAGTITGTTPVCSGATGIAYSIASVTGATGYTWAVPSGATVASGAGTNSITVNWGATAGNVTVTPTNTCGNGTAGSLAVTVNTVPSAAGTITGTTPVCSGATGIAYSIASVTGATGYTWAVPSGATVVTGAGSNSITVNWGSTAGNVTVTPTNTCGNGTAGSLAVTVNTVPSAAGTITGTTPVCSGATGIAYSIASVTGATGYTWVVPSDATIASGTGTNSITIDWGATAGSVIVTPTNGCGNGTSKSLSVTVNTVPSAAGAITGSVSVCEGQTLVAYNISAVTGATGYTWALPSGSIISGSTGRAITATIGTTSGNITVTPTNTCGNGTASSVFVTVNQVPVITATIPDSRCNSGTVTLSATASIGTIRWYNVAAGGSVLFTGSPYSPTVTATTIFYAQANNSGCLSIPRTAVVATVNSCPVTWTGAVGISWANKNNWNYGAVPTAADSVFIPAGVPNNPTLATNQNSGVLTIKPGGVLKISSTGTLNAYGDIINNGTFTALSGSTVDFTGSTAQSITGVPVLYNTVINNISGVALQSALTVNGTVSLTNGVLTTNSNLTIDFDNGGNIGYAPSDLGSISGVVTGRRDLVAAKTHYMGAPFSGVTSGQVAATTPIYVSPYWKMFTRPFSTQNWAAVTNLTTPMPLGTGFSLSLPAAAPLVFTGTYDHTFALTGPVYPNTATGKYLLVANPYPSTIDWDNATGWTNANVNAAIYYWDAPNNRYGSYVGGVGTNGATRYIPAMQAVLVELTGAGGTSSVSINNNARISTQNPVYMRTASNTVIRIRLEDSAATKNDEAVVRFNDDATTGFDQDLDAHKIPNSGLMPSV